MGFAKIICHTMLLAVVFSLFLQLAAASEDNGGFTIYEDDFIEGANLTKGLGLLDRIVFTYYGKNYSMRVLSVTSSVSLVRVESRGVEIAEGGSYSFDFDSEDGYDLTVTVVQLDPPDIATYLLELHKKEWDVEDEPDDLPQNNTNSTNTSNSTAGSNNSTASGNSPPSLTGASVAGPEDDGDGEEPEEIPPLAEPPEGAEYHTHYVFNGTSFYININLNFPQGGILGVLLMVIIVILGLVVYQKKKSRLRKMAHEMGRRVVDAKNALKGERFVEVEYQKGRKRKKSKA